MAADDGTVTDKLIETMSALAEGGLGLIVPGHMFVSQEGKAAPWQPGIHTDDMITGLRKLTDAVHQHGSRVFAQLAHAGNFTSMALTGQTPVVVSDFGQVALM